MFGVTNLTPNFIHRDDAGIGRRYANLAVINLLLVNEKCGLFVILYFSM